MRRAVPSQGGPPAPASPSFCWAGLSSWQHHPICAPILTQPPCECVCVPLVLLGQGPLGSTRPHCSSLHLLGPYFQIRSPSEVLGVRTSTSAQFSL